MPQVTLWYRRRQLFKIRCGTDADNCSSACTLHPFMHVSSCVSRVELRKNETVPVFLSLRGVGIGLQSESHTRSTLAAAQVDGTRCQPDTIKGRPGARTPSSGQRACGSTPRPVDTQPVTQAARPSGPPGARGLSPWDPQTHQRTQVYRWTESLRLPQPLAQCQEPRVRARPPLTGGLPMPRLRPSRVSRTCFASLNLNVL